MNFSEKIDAGTATEHDFNSHVAHWEAGNQDRPVSEHLGLQRDEFMYLCLEPDFRVAVENIKKSRAENSSEKS